MVSNVTIEVSLALFCRFSTPSVFGSAAFESAGYTQNRQRQVKNVGEQVTFRLCVSHTDGSELNRTNFVFSLLLGFRNYALLRYDGTVSERLQIIPARQAYFNNSIGPALVGQCHSAVLLPHYHYQISLLLPIVVVNGHPKGV